MFFVSSYSCLCQIHWNQVLSWEWRFSWSNEDVVAAALTSNAPTTSEWSTVLLFTMSDLYYRLKDNLFGIHPGSVELNYCINCVLCANYRQTNLYRMHMQYICLNFIVHVKTNCIVCWCINSIIWNTAVFSTVPHACIKSTRAPTTTFLCILLM